MKCRLTLVSSFAPLGLLIRVLLLTLVAPPALAQALPEDYTTLRHRAFDLLDRNHQLEALPLLEKLADANPSDAAVMERLGSALVAMGAKDTNPETRQRAYKRARASFLRAKELGDKSDYLTIMLEQIPENGEVSPFSLRKEVDEAIREGEGAFAQGDYASALKAYHRALTFEPEDYEAALFTGDIYFSMNQMEKAGLWFAQAIQDDPDRETAYRYWGDALLKDGKLAAAKEKYIEAVIAEPYTKTAWSGLGKWATAKKATLAHPRIESPNSLAHEGKEGKVNINIDAATLNRTDGTQHWMAYEITRATWFKERFSQEYPGATAYRHTLREEVEALSIVAELVAEDVKKGKIKNLDPALAVLLKLHEQHLLEAYVLLARADRDIAQDYPAYRKANRDKLRRYIEEYVISEPGTVQ